MRHRVFVYGTLVRGEVNHRLLNGAEWLGPHRTAPCFTLYRIGAYPGAARGGATAILGEVYALDGAGLRQLDRLEDYPILYDRHRIATPYGRAWIYVYRGRLRDRPIIVGGDWRALAADPQSLRAAGVRCLRDPKTRHRRSSSSTGSDAITTEIEERACPKKAVSPSILSNAKVFRSMSRSTGSARPIC
jgi:gamma-glutamylcyclotransferase (GGCT)/AIG2-like uncharacterized protein YtfP